MKAGERKTVTITFDFRTDRDVKDVLDQIKRELYNGEMNVSSNVAGLPYRVNVLRAIEKQEPRMEIINGMLCEVYQSKINEDGKI